MDKERLREAVQAEFTKVYCGRAVKVIRIVRSERGESRLGELKERLAPGGEAARAVGLAGPN